ncbi:uncharacterized protein LOC117512882 [Thalassophryne amazonica]|uniref:uncharacterized protein LOC117512882 n=1 Tax=Thalassophryne amazonica TaxID=390379 RepID=UPI0014718078|nr:uncharacterized protein LOC117512882 [Thalassophryne amazonica]
MEMCDEVLETQNIEKPCSSETEKEMCNEALGTENIEKPCSSETAKTHLQEMCNEALGTQNIEKPCSSETEKEICNEALGTQNIEKPRSSEAEKEICNEALGTQNIEKPRSSEAEKEVCNEAQNIEKPCSSETEKCNHILCNAVLSSLNSCEDCTGPVSSLKWLGYTCKLCSRSWHKTCFMKTMSMVSVEISSSEGSSSDKEYLPCSGIDGSSTDEEFVSDNATSSNSDDSLSLNAMPASCMSPPLLLESSKKRSMSLPQSSSSSTPQDMTSKKSITAEDLVCHEQLSDSHDTTTVTAQKPDSVMEKQTESCSEDRTIDIVTKNKANSYTHKNYCYVCKKPQSKIARHFKQHEANEPDIAAAFLLPKHSKQRKRLLEKLRNKGNHQHNLEVLESQKGLLKLKRRPKKSLTKITAATFVHCTYCKGMFLRKELWRHSARCPMKTVSDSGETDKVQVLALADIAEATFSQAISPGVWKILGKMKDDDISSVVRNDFLILQLCQSIYNKHGNDQTKSEYIRQKAREMGRLLVSLRKRSSLFSEDALKPNNFYKLVETVKDVAGYDDENNSYKTPSLALKLGHSLRKIGDIILCRAIAAEDDTAIKAAERFNKLCSSEWAGLVSHTALSTLSKSKFNKPSTIPFTKDVQLLHKYLEKKSADALNGLRLHESPQAYGELARVVLTQIIVFNRRRAGEVSKMTLESFRKRDQTELHDDIAAGLSPFEQKMSKYFSRVEIMGKRGRKVAVLLNPDIVSALTLLVDKRDACEVDSDNPYLFGRPKCLSSSFYRGQDCIRVFAAQCGAQHPEYLRSTQLRKHVATMSQILNLKDNELDQLANFLGHDIRVHRDYYRMPDATIQIAKMSKLLLAMEKGSLRRFQGKSLDEIEIEDELEPDVEMDAVGESDEDDEAPDPVLDVNDEGEMVMEDTNSLSEERQEMNMTQDEPESSKEKLKTIQHKGKHSKAKLGVSQDEPDSSREANRRRNLERPWNDNEVNAVMKHFKTHIFKGHLATMKECEQCKVAEDPVLQDRTLQNIRDFVRNRGLKAKKKLLKCSLVKNVDSLIYHLV